MKRDMDLVRLLLQRSENDAEAEAACKQYAENVRAYHVQLLIDAGLVQGVTMTGGDGTITRAIVFRLTWAGHEFLDAVREDTLWAKAKQYVIKPGASWTFDLLKEWAKHEVKQRLGLPQ
jgi:hypothetical protein